MQSWMSSASVRRRKRIGARDRGQQQLERAFFFSLSLSLFALLNRSAEPALRLQQQAPLNLQFPPSLPPCRRSCTSAASRHRCPPP